ncbi:MAG: hypothetical protein FWE91_06545 [Defluviitaleaceae bacterium]|nr:hypothetical protein [Defluviitaleaceae bacterium]
MYIFCVFAERDREKADPLVLDQWEFYPVLTSELSEMLQDQKTAGLGTILRLCPERYDYASLRDGVLWLMSGRADDDALQRVNAHNALKTG